MYSKTHYKYYRNFLHLKPSNVVIVVDLFNHVFPASNLERFFFFFSFYFALLVNWIIVVLDLQNKCDYVRLFFLLKERSVCGPIHVEA